MDEEGFFLSYKFELECIRIIGTYVSGTKMKFKGSFLIEEGISHYDSQIGEVFKNFNDFLGLKHQAVICNFNNPLMGWENETILLPMEPSDEFVTIALMRKFNALGQGKISMIECEIESSDSEGFSSVIINPPMDYLPSTPIFDNYWSDKPWWDRNDISSQDIDKQEEGIPFYASPFEPYIKQDPIMNNIHKFKPKVIKGDKLD